MACQEGGREMIRVTRLSRVRTKDECVWGFLVSETAIRGKENLLNPRARRHLLRLAIFANM